MYPFFRSLLFRLDPETAHHLTVQLMRLGGLEPIHSILRLIFSAPSKPVEAFGLNFKNPVGLAAGYDKEAVAVVGLSTLGFGHIEAGTVTPQPQPGNPSPRVFRLPQDEAVINRMGFPSRGLQYVQKQLNPALRESALEKFTGLSVGPKKKSARAYQKGDMILGINIGKNKDTPNEEAV